MCDTEEPLSLNFEEGVLSLAEVIRIFPLPVVVQCDPASSPIPVDRSRFNFDLTQPLLLYRKRTIQKVTARSLHIDPSTRNYQDIGENLLIPEDYKGWFSVLKRNFHAGPIDDLVPHFQEVSEIAETPTETFLIGGEKKVQALQVTTKENGNIVHQQRTLFPGDVLRKGKIYIGEKKRKSKYLRKTKLVTEKYIMCTDDSDREILLPFDQKGLFYTLTNNAGSVLRPVMQMSQIVSKKYPPCIVRLVYGRIPNTPCSFSGTLRLDRADLEQSVIASTIVNKRNILLELPTGCDLKFKVAITNENLIQHSGYKTALDLCNEKATIYMRHMKVCHTIETDSQREETSKQKSEINLPGRSPKARLSRSSNVTSSTDDDQSSSTDGGSDYFDMRSIKGGSIFEEIVKPDQDVSSESSCSSPDYTKMKKPLEPSFIQIVVENTFMTVPVENQKSKKHETDPPNVPPPPPPYSRTNKSLQLQDSSESNTENDELTGRRPSTITFSENRQFYDDSLTYDIPRRTRRESAPPEINSEITLNISHQKKEEFLRRSSSLSTYPEKCNTLPSSLKARMGEPLHEQHEHELEDKLSQDDVDVIPEYHSDEEFGTPMYENIAGMVKIHNDLLARDLKQVEAHLKSPTLPERKPIQKNGTPELYRGPKSGQMSPRVPAELITNKNFNSSIGFIPDLPMSRNSHSSVSDIDSEADGKPLLEIPALPATQRRSCSPSAHIRSCSPCENVKDLPRRSQVNLSKQSMAVSSGTDLTDSKDYIQKSTSEGECNISHKTKGDTTKTSSDLVVAELQDNRLSETLDRNSCEGNENLLQKNSIISSLDDISQSDDDISAILDREQMPQNSNERHSLYSDKSMAAMSMDSGIVSREPSVFGSKSSDIHTRNSLEMETYDSWKTNVFQHCDELHVNRTENISETNKPTKQDEMSTELQEQNTSFCSNVSEHATPESEKSSASDVSFESDDTSSLSCKYTHRQKPFIRSKIRKTKSRESKDISKMDIDALTKEFKRIGIKSDTIQTLRDQNLNGFVLLEKFANLDSIKEMFPNAGLIEQQKISLFIKGCKY